MEKKNITATGVIAAALAAITIGSCGFAVYKYLSTDRSLLGKDPDKMYTKKTSYYDSNINVLLGRQADWRQIASGNLLTHEDFVGIDGSTATIPITAELARQFSGAADGEIKSYVSHNKTDEAYENLIFGKENALVWYDDTTQEYQTHKQPVRFVFATPPSEDEYSLAAKNNVTLEVEPVALDGFVFITHKDNPVDSLTVQQIRDIYSGKITNWKEVGGKNEKIRPFQRTKNSGSQTAMEELVMEGKSMTDAPVAFIMEGMGDLVDAVAAEYENSTSAIGYTYYYYINNLYRNEDIKVLNIDGVSPENENLVSEKYPFTAAYYAVIRSDEPEGSVYRKLRDYMLTDEGQEIVRLAGYCPIKE